MYDIKRHPKHILIVDDEPRIALILARGLKALGPDYVTDTAFGGQIALTKAKLTAYDLVLTDCQMPEVSGLDLIDELPNLSPHTHLVLMTAHGTSALRQHVATLPLDGYIEKPFTLNELRSLVTRLLHPVQQPVTV